MEVKPSYKETEVGIIPKEWEVTALKGRIAITHGFAFGSEYFVDHGPYRLTTPGHFREEGGFRDIGEKQKFYDGPVPSGYMLEPGDMIVAMTEQKDGLLGSAAFIPGVEGFLHNQRLGRIRVLSADVDLAFLFYVFNSHRYRSKVRETAAGTKVQHTSPEKLLRIPVCLPALGEQRAIAKALGDVDALLDGLNWLIAKKRNLKQAAMQQLLTGRTRLPGFHDGWPVQRIADVATPRSEKNVRGESLPVLTCSKHLGFVDSLGFFKNQVFSDDLSSYKLIRRGEIGYPANHVEEGSIGLQDLYDVALVSPIYVVFAVSDDVSSLFLHRMLKLDSYRQKFKTATSASVDRRGSLRWPAFSALDVLTPSLPEQTAIADVLRDMETELAALEARREKTRALKQAMTQELLTGRTRLV